MKVFNVRAGFATNSSSSHSIIMMPAGARVRSQEYDAFRYGWEEFTLADRESKSAYFATQLYQALDSRNLPKDVSIEMINDWLGTEYEPGDFEDAYVDHQSTWSLANGDEDLNPEMVRAMRDFVMRPDVVILGGNDNDHGQTPPDGSFRNELTEAVGDHSYSRVRQDGRYWSLYNTWNGNKVRFSIDDSAPDYEKSTYPELVDLKLTDQCPYQCAFCFQGSTPQGQHASLDTLVPIIQSLGRMGVFEIAFGCGEPTHYPYLREVLEITAACGIAPNFTTFGVDWLRDERLVETVKKYVKAIGVSVHNARDLNKVAKIREVLGNTVRVMAQHVVGSVDMEVTASVMEETWKGRYDILLLGYKRVGFGADIEPHDMTGLDTLLRLRQDQSQRYWGSNFSMLGVDTSFVQQFDPILQDLGIPSVLKTSEEGKFSMYIDAVTGAQGPSSYMPELMEPLDLQDLDNSIRSAYKEW